MANITRDQYDPTRGVQKKVFQTGTRLTDADLNEQVDVTLHAQRRLLSILIGGLDVRFENGFNGFTLTTGDIDGSIKVVAGSAAFHLESNQAVLVDLAAVHTITGITAYPSGGRTDLVYIDLEEAEISASVDPNLVNPAEGEETCRDIRLGFSFKVAEGASSLPAAPAGHVYRLIGKIEKTDAGGYIDYDNLTTTLQVFGGTSAIDVMEIPIWVQASESHAATEPMDLDNENMMYKATTGDQSGRFYNTVIKIPYRYDPAHKYVAIHCELEPAFGDGYVELSAGADWGSIKPWVSEPGFEQVISYLYPLSTAETGKLYTIEVILCVQGGTQATLWMRRPVIVAGLGRYTMQGGV